MTGAFSPAQNGTSIGENDQYVEPMDQGFPSRQRNRHGVSKSLETNAGTYGSDIHASYGMVRHSWGSRRLREKNPAKAQNPPQRFRLVTNDQ